MLDPGWATRNAPTVWDMPVPPSRLGTLARPYSAADYHLWWRMRQAFMPIVVTDPRQVFKVTGI